MISWTEKNMFTILLNVLIDFCPAVSYLAIFIYKWNRRISRVLVIRYICPLRLGDKTKHIKVYWKANFCTDTCSVLVRVRTLRWQMVKWLIQALQSWPHVKPSHSENITDSGRCPRKMIIVIDLYSTILSCGAVQINMGV